MPRIISLFSKLSIKAKYAVLAFAGLLAVFAFAPYFVFPLYFIGIIILFIAIDETKTMVNKRRAAFGRGFVFAFFHFALGMFWVGQAFLVDAEKFAWLLPFAITALPAFIASFYGLMSVIYVSFASKGAGRVFLFAACFSLIEFVRSNAFTGLPWNLSAYIFKAGGIISQSAAVFGPFGMGLFIVFVAIAPLVHNEKGGRIIAAFATIITLFSLVFGYYRLNYSKSPKPNETTIAIGQIGLSQKELWDPKNKDKVINLYIDQLKTPQAQNADLIVWPEGTFPTEFFSEASLLETINPLIKGKVLIVGAPRADLENGNVVYFNSMAWLSGKDGQYPLLLALYDKTHLVPFGEYLPYRAFFNAIGIESLVAYGTDFSKSNGPKTISIPGLPTMEPRICYEIIFPGFGLKNKGEMIVNSSVDAWYGDFLGPDQHYNQARYRAIEEGKPLIRAAAGGWSGIVDPFGRADVEFRKGNQIISAKPTLGQNRTIYSILGELAYFPVWVVFLAIGFLFIREK